MSIIRYKLEGLYQRNQQFEKFYPLEETAFKLQTFITSELMQGEQYVNHKRFGMACGYSESQSLILLMAISSMTDNGLLQLNYHFSSDDGEERLLLESELNTIVISDDDTGGKSTLEEAIKNGRDINISFEIDKRLKKELLG
ncbi:hypothetical protein [Rossellomorea marisflavi]|uniref:hypothetical protein n=1 Tax=Rossellomorea marisflavi TaxID=189381 RepID=UPI003FA184F5